MSYQDTSNLCPFYQIEFNAVAAGKTIAMSKRHIRWRFGFPNKEAIKKGETGTACRGVEHEVTVVWSVTSGKRRIMSDNQEIHQSTVRSGALEHSWVTTGNHVIKVVAHSTTSNFTTGKQYDLFVDGHSFFNMPKVFELGLKGITMPSGAPAPAEQYATNSGRYKSPGGSNEPASSQQEQENLRQAIAASLRESHQHLQSRGVIGEKSPPPAINVPTESTRHLRPSSAPVKEENLIDFLDEATPSAQNHGAVVPTVTQASQWNQSFAAPPRHPSSNQAQFASQMQPMTNQIHYQPTLNHGESLSLPGAPVANTFEPQTPSYSAISNQIMQTYSSNSQQGNMVQSNSNASPGQVVPAQISVMGGATGAGTYAQGLPPRQTSDLSNSLNGQYHAQPSYPQNYSTNGGSSVPTAQNQNYR